MCIVVGYEYFNSGQARACKRDLIRFSLNWFGTCKRGYRDYPQFGRVEIIYIADSNSVYFHLRIMNTVDFNIHRHFYIIELSSSYKTVSLICTMSSPYTLHLRRSVVNSNCPCAIPKHHILHSLHNVS